MFLKYLVPFMIVSIVSSLFAPSFGLYAQNRDTEYENMIAIDTVDVSVTDEFVQIENSIEKPLIDISDIKNAHKYAKDYVSNLELYDIHWKGKHPKLIGKGVPYYADDENTPIVYEWKIRCDDTKDCGSVIVATIDGVSKVMESSTYGSANYERLGANKKSKKNKLYYYSAFDQYIESTDGKNTTVDMIDPDKQMKKSASERKDELKGEKEKRKAIRKNGKLKFQVGDPGEDITTTSPSVSTGTVAVDVPATSLTANCNSAVPCYTQFTTTGYAGSIGTPCYSGCGPTALAIIFGYYDRKGTFPNLIGDNTIVASDINVDQTMVNTIRGYMGTVCDATHQGATGFTSLPLGMQYARDRGYGNSANGTYTAGYTAAMSVIQTEINAGRPVIVDYSSATTGHIMAGYGYQTNPNMVHINFGWGNTYQDKYLPVSLIVITSTQVGTGNPVIGMRFHSVVTVPIQ